MTVFLCTDDRGGMLFNKRRQSRDSKVIEDVSRSVGDGTLYISDFSEALFAESDISVISVSDPLVSARENGCVFVECHRLSEHIRYIDTLIIYRWNKKYPYDFLLDIAPEECGFKLCETAELQGSSHDKITKEIYRK